MSELCKDLLYHTSLAALTSKVKWNGMNDVPWPSAICRSMVVRLWSGRSSSVILSSCRVPIPLAIPGHWGLCPWAEHSPPLNSAAACVIFRAAKRTSSPRMSTRSALLLSPALLKPRKGWQWWWTFQFHLCRRWRFFSFSEHLRIFIYP